MNNIAHYTDMKDSGIKWIGMVPASWNVRTLYQLVTRVNNKNSDLAEKNLLSLSYGKIKRKDINTTDGLLPASFDGYNIIEGGDIVLWLTDLQNDHTSLRVGHATERGIITSAYTTLRPINPAHSRYLYYLIHAFDLKKGFYGMGSGVRQGLNFDEVKELRVVLPYQDEQDKIVRFLDEQCAKIDKFVGEAKTSIDEYKEWQKAIIFETVTNGLTPYIETKQSEVEWIGVIPKGWNVRKLGDIAKRLTDFVASGSFASLRENVEYLDSPDYARLIRTVDLSESTNRQPVYINESAYVFLKNSNLFGGELILPNIGSVGSVYQYRPIYERASLAPNSILLDMNGSNRFYYYWFRNYKVAESLRQIGGNAVQCKFNKTQLRQYLVVQPPLQEQEAIATYLDNKCSAIDRLIVEKNNLIEDLEQFKRSLIYETVTGKRKVV